MEIVIRVATTNDSEAIAELSGQLGYQTLTASVFTRLERMLTHADHSVFVATEREKVVGWIHGFYALRVESDVFVEIGGLVVHEHFRKYGIGKKLVDQVLEWTSLNECDKVRVRCNVNRQESHRFYENIGFELAKEQGVLDKRLNQRKD